jgi:hypothetical protein
MKNLALILFGLMACAASHALAQTSPSSTPKPAPPPGPLIQKRAPEFSQWVIYSKADDGGKAESKSSPDGHPKFAITKTGKIINVIYLDEHAKAWSIWCLPEGIVAIYPDGKNVGLVERPTDPDSINPLYQDFSESDFSGFSWISADNFTGIGEVHGQKCLLFKKGQAEASTDLVTRLPVSLVNENGTTSYEFRAPPTVLLTLPEQVQRFIDAKKSADNSASRHARRPF